MRKLKVWWRSKRGSATRMNRRDADSAGWQKPTKTILSSPPASARDLLGSSISVVWETGWISRNNGSKVWTSLRFTGSPSNVRSAKKPIHVTFSHASSISIVVIKSQGKTFNLVDYERPEGDYLVLESLNQEKNTSRIIHIIRPNDKKDSFKLGRGHESDLRINDISVSRCHAIIKFKDGKF